MLLARLSQEDIGVGKHRDFDLVKALMLLAETVTQASKNRVKS
jgi:hypothetical protein